MSSKYESYSDINNKIDIEGLDYFLEYYDFDEESLPEGASVDIVELVAQTKYAALAYYTLRNRLADKIDDLAWAENNPDGEEEEEE